MSRPEFVRSLEGEVPAVARFVEVDGDVDYVLRWQTSDLDPVYKLVAEEASAWRQWRDAEDRRLDFARLHRHASETARLAQATWHGVAIELARRHPSFSEFTGTAREPLPGADPGTSRAEAAAAAMISRIRARAESMDGPVVRDPYAEPDPDEPNFQIIVGPTGDTEDPEDPDAPDATDA